MSFMYNISRNQFLKNIFKYFNVQVKTGTNAMLCRIIKLVSVY